LSWVSDCRRFADDPPRRLLPPLPPHAGAKVNPPSACSKDRSNTNEQGANRRPSLKARKTAENYLLERRLFRSLRTGKVIDKRWLRFSFPTFWHYDALRETRLSAKCAASLTNVAPRRCDLVTGSGSGERIPRDKSTASQCAVSSCSRQWPRPDRCLQTQPLFRCRRSPDRGG